MSRRHPLGALVALVMAAVAGAIQAAPQTDAAVSALKDPDPSLRLAGIRALRNRPWNEAIGPLGGVVVDPVDQIQQEALDAILSLCLAEPVQRRSRVGLVIEVRGESRAQAAFEAGPVVLAPVSVPAGLVTELVAAAGDLNPRVQSDATYLLGLLTTPPLEPAGIQALVAGLVNPDPGMRTASAKVLGRLRATSAGEALIYALNDPYERVRIAAMRALGELRETRAVRALEDQLAFYERGPSAEAALDGLARIAYPTSLPLFETHARQGSEAMRRAAFEGLGRTAGPGRAAEIEAWQAGDSRSVQLARAFALHHLGRSRLETIVEGLVDRRTGAQAREYLLELGPSIGTALVAYLHDSDPRVRAEVAIVRGLLGDDAAIAQLDPLRADPDPQVAAAAVRAIARLRLP